MCNTDVCSPAFEPTERLFRAFLQALWIDLLPMLLNMAADGSDQIVQFDPRPCWSHTPYYEFYPAFAEMSIILND